MPPTDEAHQVIKAFKFPIPATATEEEIQKLGSVLLTIQNLNGGTPLREAMSNGSYGFRYENGDGHSAQQPQYILISRNGAKDFGMSAAQIAHELGHLVGNQGGYPRYQAAVNGEFCQITRYSYVSGNANEQFAEVFAAFVTAPWILQNHGSRACNKAWLFFRNEFFQNGELAEECLP